MATHGSHDRPDRDEDDARHHDQPESNRERARERAAAEDTAGADAGVDAARLVPARARPDGSTPLVLVTGVTGYIGGRLVPELLAAGYRVRVLARNAVRLRGREWYDDVEVAETDATDEAAVREALSGVDVAYYLLHSLDADPAFAAYDRRMALGFSKAAREADVGRIVYLGGLYPADETLSVHLESRRDVEEIFLASGVPTTALRAAVIIGSGSASFEMLRYLTERLPLIIRPKWLATRIQPIAVRDTLRYLVGSAGMPPDVNRGFDIGGTDVLTYLEMMQTYAKVAGLPPRRAIPVPVFTPGLSVHWINTVTPVPRSIAAPLVHSIVHEVVTKEHDIDQYVPTPPEGLLGLERAITLALKRVRNLDVTTSWRSASTAGAPSDPLPSDPDWAGGSLYVDDRTSIVDATPQQLWQVIRGIGGMNGWYSWSLGWQVRGIMDRVVGGPGLSRGRENPERLAVGDALDWWRVEEIREDELLRLRAEMRVPGLAWLDLMVEEDDRGHTVFRQKALFHPRGLSGWVYWQLIKPFHGIIFGGMQRNVARAAEDVEPEEHPAGDADRTTRVNEDASASGLVRARTPDDAAHRDREARGPAQEVGAASGAR